MDYFNAFWFGGLSVPDPDPSGQDKADAWPCDGTSGMQRRPVKCRWHLPAAGGFCRCRGLRPADRFRTCIMGGYEKSH